VVVVLVHGRIYSSEVQRGFDVLQLSGLRSLSRASRRVPYLNSETQEPLRRRR
jgi:hypothetical protein